MHRSQWLNRFASIQFSSLIPFLRWLPELKQPQTLKNDILAGLSVAMLLIPQSMAYAHLAGLPVYVGLYSAFLPPIIAALFSSSRVLSTGPVPVTSLLTAVALQPIAAIGTEAYFTALALLTCLIGLIQLTLSFIRFGVFVNFLSFTMLLGFVNAVAIIIACLQISNLFGVYSAPSPYFFQTLWQVLRDAWANPHWPTMAISALAFTLIMACQKWFPRVPGVLCAVVLTTLVSWMIGYEKKEAVAPSQILNLSVQNMLEDARDFPERMERQLKLIQDSKQKINQASSQASQFDQSLEQAIYRQTQSKWELERMLTRQQQITEQLSRLRFKKFKTEDGESAFYVVDQMTPIGREEPHEWRMDDVASSSGKVTLQSGGEVIGRIPRGLPSFQLFSLKWENLTELFMAALVIALVGFTEAITIAKRMATEAAA